MKLVFHQLRKDIRQFAGWLAIWLSLLLAELAVNLGWIGKIEFDPARGFVDDAQVFSFLPAVVRLLFCLLPALVVLADSPARRHGFLATRPVPKLVLFVEKLLFTLLLVVAPFALAETVHLHLRGAPMGIVFDGTMERLLLALPVAILCGTLASLLATMAGLTRAFVIVAGAIVPGGASAFVFATDPLESPFQSFALNPSESIAATVCIAILVTLFALWHAQRVVGWPARWTGLLLCVAITFVVAKVPGWRFAELRPANAAAAESIVQSNPPAVSWSGIELSRFRVTGATEADRFSVELRPRAPNLPNGREIRWKAVESSMIQTGGVVFHRHRARPRDLLENKYRDGALDSEVAAWAQLFPQETFFALTGGFEMGLHTEPVHLLTADLPADDAKLSADYRIHAQLAGKVLQWRRAGEMPARAGEEMRSESATWRIEKVLTSSPEVRIALEHSRIELLTGGNRHSAVPGNGRQPSIAILIHDLEKNIAHLAGGRFHALRGSHTALPRYFASVHFKHESLSESALARMRLIILEPVWLGTAETRFDSETFALKDKIPVRGPGVAFDSSVTPEELFRRISSLEAPATNAPDREVSVYLARVFRILRTRHHRFEPGHPLYNQMARYVPNHLDLFLGLLPELPDVPAMIAADVIRLGATESQKARVIAALPASQQLAGVILERGWVRDARDELKYIAERKHPMTFSTAQCLALLRDPEVHPRLVDSFAESMDPIYERLLRNIGLGSEAERIVAQAWNAQKPVLWESPFHSEPKLLELALRNGHASAVRWLYALLDISDPVPSHASHYWASALCNGFWSAETNLNQLQHENPDAVIEWLRRHRPEDFTFNPVRRRFALKSDLSSIELP